jgi:Fur family transcriptional regulator, ferric uptake regulator
MADPAGTVRKSRLTRQRRVILESLCAVTTHPTAEELYQAVREKLPRISLGTVYRNLDVLSASGMVLKLEMCGCQRRFDGNTEPHYHIRCLGCGKVDDLPGKPVVELKVKSAGYEVLGHRLEFVGLCPACHDGKAKSARKEARS